MADSVTTKRFPPIETKIPNVDEVIPNEKVWEYQRRVLQSQINKGSRYPPFSIEHMPYERQRLDKPMTEADRFLRKQWLQDQNLSPNEPRYVADAKPMFKLRRMYRQPWDSIEKALSTVVSKDTAAFVRRFVPRALIGYAVCVAAVYQITYNPKSWESHHYWTVYGGRRPRFYGEDNSQLPADPQFASRGFYGRTSHLNLVTSAQGQ